MSTLTKLELSVIRTDGGTQPRAQLDQGVIEEYAEAMKAGATFPPVIVFDDGEHYWLADGFHRLAAAIRAELLTISVELRRGIRRDAVLYSVGANATHGLRRTNSDKRRAVETLLRDPEWLQWSDREIARLCGVHHQLVGNLRRELHQLDDSSSQIRKAANGRIINTANIGKHKKDLRDIRYPGPGSQETKANPVEENLPQQPIGPNPQWQLPPAITIDVTAEVLEDEQSPTPAQLTPETDSPSLSDPDQAREEAEPPAEPYKPGDRIRILRRQDGADKWRGKAARIREITPDGRLRVDVEGHKGVRFTLNPEWVEPMETPESYKVQPKQVSTPQWADEPDPETPAIAGDASDKNKSAVPRFQAGDQLYINDPNQQEQQWVGEVTKVIEVAEDRVQVVIEIPRPMS